MCKIMLEFSNTKYSLDTALKNIKKAGFEANVESISLMVQQSMKE